MGSMRKGVRSWSWVAGGVLLAGLAVFSLVLGTHAAPSPQEQHAPGSAHQTPADALRLNTLGVAYMNQGKSAEAQKEFEQALAADANFAQARMNLGISLLAQQKLEQARAALEDASSKLPDDPYAWYNLGLVYKDSAQPGKRDRGVSARRENGAGGAGCVLFRRLFALADAEIR